MKPEPVLQAMDDYYRNFPTCGGRSLHRLAFDVTEHYETARGQLQCFVGAADASEIVFTRNATEAINIVAWGLDLQRGDTVLSSDREHNSMLCRGTHSLNGQACSIRPSRRAMTYISTWKP
jgi:cysteine desulfurase/selenocysteine lyase